MDIFAEFNAVLPLFNRSRYFKQLKEQAEAGTPFIVDLEQFSRLLPPDKNFEAMFKRVRIALERIIASGGPIDYQDFNQQDFFYLLYFYLLENAENPDTDVCIEGLFILMCYSKVRDTQEIFEEFMLCDKFYRVCLKEIGERYAIDTIPKNLFYMLAAFLKSQEDLKLEVVEYTNDFLFIYITQHFDMIQSLKIFDAGCKPGFLAFVCLSVLINKKYPEQPEIKQQIIKAIFEKLEAYSQPNSILGNMQQSILTSNLRSFVRQVGPCFNQEQELLITTIVNIAPKYASSETFALLMDQFPLGTYIILLDIVSKLAKQRYDSSRQEFCFLLLQHPYMLNNIVNNNTIYPRILSNLIEAIIWPLYKNDVRANILTIPYVDKILKIRERSIQKVVQDVLVKSMQNGELQVLSSIYQLCDPTWVKKSMNQMYITIYSQIYVLVNQTYLNTHKQFCELVSNARIPDLVPCLDFLCYMLLKLEKDYCHLINPILVKNALRPTPYSVPYLKSLFKLIFGGLPHSTHGLNVGYSMLSLELDLDDLLKKMASHNVLKPLTLDQVSEFLATDEKLWIYLDILMPIFERPFPKAFLTYWNSIDEKDLFQSQYVCYIFSSLSKTVDCRRYFHDSELGFFHRYFKFVENGLRDRTLPTRFIQSALVVCKKSFKKVKDLSITELQKIFKELEVVVNNAMIVIHTTGSIKNSKILGRDFTIYADLNLVFCEEDQFWASQETIGSFSHVITDLSLNVMQDYTDYVKSMMRCAIQLAVRHKSLRAALVKKSKMIVGLDEPRLQIIGLNCLHDLILTNSCPVDDFERYLIGFITSYNEVLQAQSISMYISLVFKEYVNLNHWQLYALLYYLNDSSTAHLVGNRKLRLFYESIPRSCDKYFVNIILYLNNVYDYKEYTLDSFELDVIPKKPLAANMRRKVYVMMLMNLEDKKYKIINNIYLILIKTFFRLPIPYPRNFELLQDIINLTHIILRNNHPPYPIHNEEMCKDTVTSVRELANVEPREYNCDPGLNSSLTIIVTSLIDILALLDYRGLCMLEEVVCLIFFLCHSYLDNFKCIILEQGSNSQFKKQLLKLPPLYETNKRFLHFDEVEPMTKRYRFG